MYYYIKELQTKKCKSKNFLDEYIEYEATSTRRISFSSELGDLYHDLGKNSQPERNSPISHALPKDTFPCLSLATFAQGVGESHGECDRKLKQARENRR